MKSSDDVIETREKLEALSLNDKKPQEMVLPDNLKEIIKENVAVLKEILKDDTEFAEKMIWLTCNVGEHILPSDVTAVVYKHYSDIFTACKKEYKGWPIWLERLCETVDLLDHLAAGYDSLIFDYVIESYALEDRSKICMVLGELAKVEIGFQYNPEVKYQCDIASLVGKPPISYDEDLDFS